MRNFLGCGTWYYNFQLNVSVMVHKSYQVLNSYILHISKHKRQRENTKNLKETQQEKQTLSVNFSVKTEIVIKYPLLLWCEYDIIIATLSQHQF